MSSPFRRFPDVQRVLVDDLQTVAGEGRTGVETPADLQTRLPFIRVLRVGGGSDRVSDRAAVDIDVFASTYTEAEELAERVRQHIVGPPPPIARLDKAVCETGPRELPWGDDDNGVRRFGATYLITARRHLSS